MGVGGGKGCFEEGEGEVNGFCNAKIVNSNGGEDTKYSSAYEAGSRCAAENNISILGDVVGEYQLKGTYSSG